LFTILSMGENPNSVWRHLLLLPVLPTMPLVNMPGTHSSNLSF